MFLDQALDGLSMVGGSSPDVTRAGDLGDLAHAFVDRRILLLPGGAWDSGDGVAGHDVVEK